MYKAVIKAIDENLKKEGEERLQLYSARDKSLSLPQQQGLLVGNESGQEYKERVGKEWYEMKPEI